MINQLEIVDACTSPNPKFQTASVRPWLLSFAEIASSFPRAFAAAVGADDGAAAAAAAAADDELELGKSIWRTMERFFFIFLRLRLFSLFTLALSRRRPFLEATGDTSADAAAAAAAVAEGIWPRRLLTGSLLHKG